MKKQFSFFCLAIILFQSCVVYQKNTVPISLAVNHGKVKLITTTGNKLLIKNIEKVDSTYYGDLGSYKLRIPPGEVEAIYLYDKKKTNKRTFIGMGVGVGVLIGLFVIVAYSSFSL
jgi:hypothetical protein